MATSSANPPSPPPPGPFFPNASKHPAHDYAHEPLRPSPHLIVQKQYPYNAEPTLPVLVRNYLTPVNEFFKRNHGPIPLIEEAAHAVRVVMPAAAAAAAGGEQLIEMTMSVADFKKFDKHTVVAAIECAGNRRQGLADVRKVKGVLWRDGTIGNAAWSGARLCDVLAHHSITPATYPGVWHLHMEAVGDSEEDPRYASSIPLSHAMDPRADILVAYEMNGVTLPRDHGFPLRIIVPGCLGARSVKFVGLLRVQSNESSSFYQQRDYKLMPPDVDEDRVNLFWDRLPSLQEMNVQSVICEPEPNATIVRVQGEPLTIRGYAFGGGGRGIQRLDVSLDGGKTWLLPADVYQLPPHNGSGKQWAWALWSVRVPRIPATVDSELEIVCRAWDTAGNTQPDAPVWNFRGVMNNACHRVKVRVVDAANRVQPRY